MMLTEYAGNEPENSGRASGNRVGRHRMQSSKIPSDDQVVAALKGLSGRATARALCNALVASGHPTAESQLAIQRAIERGRARIGSQWMIEVLEETQAA